MFATGALGAVTLVTFALVEREAAEPVLPPALWRERVFVMAGALSLIVGFALFGAVTFLPPEAVAVLVPTPRPCSIHNPTAITAVPTTGNALYVRRDADAGDRRLGRYGGVRLDLHQPADRSAERRRAAAALERIVAGGGRLTGEQVLRPPAGERLAYQEAYVHALTPVFAVAAGVALVGFAVSWLLPERPLRATAATSRGLEDSLAAPRSPVSLAEVERALSLCTTGEERERFHRAVAERAGVDVSPGAAWALVRIDEYGVAGARAEAEHRRVSAERIAAVVGELRERGLVAGEEGTLAETPHGREIIDRVVAARRNLLVELVADPDAHRRPDVDELLRRLARELVGERP